LGTSDIAVIVKRYQGATFGFASRNFYVAFLAALEVDRHAEKYFGPLTRLPDTDSTPVELPDYVPVDALAKAFKVDPGALRVLNPALRPPIWNGSRFVPRGYALRLPGTPPQAEIAAGWERLPAAQRYVAQRNDGSHRMRRNETLAGIAAASGVSLNRLLAANGWSGAHAATKGEAVRIPLPATRAEISGGTSAAVAAISPAAVAPAPEAPTVARPAPRAPASMSASASASAAVSARVPAAAPVSVPAPVPVAPVAESLPPPATVKVAPPPKEPVSQRQTDSNALLPVAAPTGNSDSTDYSVAADNTVVVQAGETLGHYADWSGVGSPTLRSLNKLRKNAMVTLGHKVKLDFSKVSAEQFAATRRDYHRHLQEEFFATHRIAGTENYAVKRGESLWVIAQQHADLPVWLVAQYNPDVDFNDVRPGTAIALPRVVPINRQ
jgi:membrane-bound lytic murein transglycosylase D